MSLSTHTEDIKTMKILLKTTLALSVATLLSACSDGDSNVASETLDQVQGVPSQTDGSVAPAGAVTHYGSVTVADESGQVSDLVASFYKLGSGVSADFLGSQLSAQSATCEVQDDGVIDFEEISLVYVPNVPGVDKESVTAGEQIILSSDMGTFATLDEQPATDFIFYDLTNMDMLDGQAVPANLVADIPGSEEIPTIAAAVVPVVEALGIVEFGSADSVSSNSRFTWTPSTQTGSVLRIFTSTAGGFFLENGVTVTCLVPDTGSFEFPADVKTKLGSEFSGSRPIFSRLSINTVQKESTFLYIIRESFSELD